MPAPFDSLHEAAATRIRAFPVTPRIGMMRCPAHATRGIIDASYVVVLTTLHGAPKTHRTLGLAEERLSAQRHAPASGSHAFRERWPAETSPVCVCVCVCVCVTERERQKGRARRMTFSLCG